MVRTAVCGAADEGSIPSGHPSLPHPPSSSRFGLPSAQAATVGGLAAGSGIFAAVMAVSALSYNADLFLFGRFVDRYRAAGTLDVEQPGTNWPKRLTGEYGARSYFKWMAGADYQRDVVVPVYDWYQVTLAPYSFFRSDRRTILFHPLGHKGDWYPFECAAVERAGQRPHDEADWRFLAFLAIGGERGIDQRRDRRANVAEAGAARQQVDVDAAARGMIGDRQAAAEDDDADHQDGGRGIGDAVVQRDGAADRLQRQERDRAECGVGDARCRPAARAASRCRVPSRAR